MPPHFRSTSHQLSSPTPPLAVERVAPRPRGVDGRLAVRHVPAEPAELEPPRRDPRVVDVEVDRPQSHPPVQVKSHFSHLRSTFASPLASRTRGEPGTNPSKSHIGHLQPQSRSSPVARPTPRASGRRLRRRGGTLMSSGHRARGAPQHRDRCSRTGRRPVTVASLPLGRACSLWERRVASLFEVDR